MVGVFDDKNRVESGEDCGHEVDVFFAFHVIPATEHGVDHMTSQTGAESCLLMLVARL